MAGSEKRGIQNASAGLFNQSICILTPTKNSDNSALLKTEKLWRALGARVVRLNPDFHDEALSFVSHLPHLVAFSLINTIPERFLGYSSGGLKDTTRIASSDHILWRDILLDNKDNVLKAIKLFEKSLNELRGALKCSDSRALGKIILKSKKKRARLQ